MKTTTREYCAVCGDDRPFCHSLQSTEFTVRGETLTLEVPVRTCQECKTVEEEEGVDPAEIAFAEYRRRKGLLDPEAIKALREGYRLSQKSFAALLGMSEATINRYEQGGLQDAAHDQAIRACQSIDVMHGLLQRRGDRLSPWQRKRVEEALTGKKEQHKGSALEGKPWTMPKEVSLNTGFRRFDYSRYVAVVLWFCRRLKTVTPTSLNKLLFYADFLCFQSESVSLTGTAYRRLAYGPVPSDYGGLREQMELDQYVNVGEVEWSNGNLGEEYSPGLRADELTVSLSARELRVLETVARVLGQLTPSELSERSHQETAWSETEDRNLIPYDKASELSLAIPD